MESHGEIKVLMEFTFLLKKLIAMLLMPMPLGVLMLIIATIFLHQHKLLKAKIFLTLSIVWFFLISYAPLINHLLYPFETLYPTLKIAPKHIQYIYVLGNGHHTDDALPITSQVSQTASIRLNEAIRIYEQLEKNPTIIVSGYTGLFDPTPGAIMQKRLALALGLQEDHIHIEPKAKDTQEEAKAAKAYIGRNPFILVTSASHMKRAMRYFKEEGLSPIPAPTNHIAHIQHMNYLDIFSANTVRKTTIFWHELLGLLWQKVKGF
jgi:uncharacterized SAM-binding protein YcdF (DUF218 family)